MSEQETTKHAGGRPPKFTNPEDMQRLIDLYFLACRVNISGDEKLLDGLSEDDLLTVNSIDSQYPTVSGLSYMLDMTTEGFRNYGTQDKFSATVKRAKQRIEIVLEQNLYGQAVAGTIFNLKNNFNWKDKTEVDNHHSFNVNMPDDDVSTL